MGKRMETRTQMTPATRLSCSDTGKQQQSLNLHWPPLMMIIMIIVIITIDTFFLVVITMAMQMTLTSQML